MVSMKIRFISFLQLQSPCNVQTWYYGQRYFSFQIGIAISSLKLVRLSYSTCECKFFVLTAYIFQQDHNLKKGSRNVCYASFEDSEIAGVYCSITSLSVRGYSLLRRSLFGHGHYYYHRYCYCWQWIISVMVIMLARCYYYHHYYSFVP